MFSSFIVKAQHTNTNPRILSSSSFLQIGNQNCVFGHLSGMKPTCGSDGCLQILSLENKRVDIEGHTRRILQNISQVHDIEGWIMSTTAHAWFISNITLMQWHFGVYGSVGEIGVYHGKYSTLLALNTNVSAGERNFVADIFGIPNEGTIGYGNSALFFNNLGRIGLSLTAPDHEHYLHTWHDSSVWFSKAALIHWNLPAVRLVSIDGWHSQSVVFSDFQTVACLIREGAILVFDDTGCRWEWEVDVALNDFFNLYGLGVLRPLVSFTNKLFVCTMSHHTRYTEYIKRNFGKHFNLREVKGRLYNMSYDYVYLTNTPYQ